MPAMPAPEIKMLSRCMLHLVTDRWSGVKTGCLTIGQSNELHSPAWLEQVVRHAQGDLACAEAEFARRGYYATSLRAIAARIGISKAAVLYHFPEKAERLVALATAMRGD